MSEIVKIRLNDRRINYNGGYCYAVYVPELEEYGDNSVSLYRSSGILYEDGKPIGKPHAVCTSVENIGKGYFLHWESALNFSTSDNTNPLENGREYIFERDKSAKSYKKQTCVLDESTGLLDMPQVLQVALTNGCNLKCRVCRPDPYHEKVSYLETDLLHKIIDELFEYLTDIRIDSRGELFLHKDTPFFLQEASKRDIDVFVSTNGMLLNDENIELLINSSVRRMQIPVDSADKSTLEWIRCGVSYEKLINNIKNLVKKNRENGSKITIDLHVALFRKNIDHLSDLIRLASELGVDGVTYTCGFCLDHMDIYDSPLWSMDEGIESLKEAKETARELGIEFNGPVDAAEQKEIYCDYLFKKIFISENGEVWPCCIDRKVMGHIAESSIKDIWHGDEYSKLRETYFTDKPSWYKCSKCYVTRSFAKDAPERFFTPLHWDKVREIRGER